ncbi:MAG: DUF3987 domain-containing protein [Candidatus Rokuibacteriota bacterium]
MRQEPGAFTTALGAEELTPEELPFLRFEATAQERFDAWRGDLEQTLRAEEDHPVWLSHVAKYRSLMPSLALIGHLIDGVAGGPTGPVSQAAAARAVAWCEYLQGHARRLYASVTDRARVAAARLAAQLTHGRLPSPFTACQRSPYSEPPGSGKLSHPGSPIQSQAGSPMLSHPGAGMLSHPAGGDRTSWC